MRSKKILDTGYKQAIDVLKINRKKLDIIADELVKRETIEAEEFAALMKDRHLEKKLAKKSSHKVN